MASTLSLGPVHAAILAKVRAIAPLVAQTGSVIPAARITDQGPVAMPYVLVKGVDENPFNTMGPPDLPKWGGVDGVNIRVVSQYRGEEEVHQFLNIIVGALNGQPLGVSGFPTAIVKFERSAVLEDTVNNILTRELVGTFSVTAHQSA